MPRNQDDDEDRPRRRRPTDDDDDERPNVRRKPSRDDDDDDDDRPTVRRRRDYDDDDEDRPRRRIKKPKQPTQVSILGVLSLIKGIGALLVSFIPCIGGIAIFGGIMGLGEGLIGYFVAKKSNGRQGTGLSIAGMSVSGAAIVISLIWIIIGASMSKKIDKEVKQAEAEYEKERIERQANAAKDVKAAAAGNAIQISAVEFARAYERDEDRADAMYQNKVLEVTGTIKEVDFVNEDAYVVLLRGVEDVTVDCQFTKDPATRTRLAQLRPGETITIRGKCTAHTVLEACVIVK